MKFCAGFYQNVIGVCFGGVIKSYFLFKILKLSEIFTFINNI